MCINDRSKGKTLSISEISSKILRSSRFLYLVRSFALAQLPYYMSGEMASQADQFYYSQIGCRSQQKHRFCGKSISRGSRELPRTYGVSHAHHPLCSAAMGPWKQSNVSFLLRHHWVAAKQSRASCPRRDENTGRGWAVSNISPFYLILHPCYFMWEN